jgi:hypothetical protein
VRLPSPTVGSAVSAAVISVSLALFSPTTSRTRPHHRRMILVSGGHAARTYLQIRGRTRLPFLVSRCPHGPRRHVRPPRFALADSTVRSRHSVAKSANSVFADPRHLSSHPVRPLDVGSGACLGAGVTADSARQQLCRAPTFGVRLLGASKRSTYAQSLGPDPAAAQGE